MLENQPVPPPRLLLQVERLTKHFPVPTAPFEARKSVRAVEEFVETRAPLFGGLS